MGNCNAMPLLGGRFETTTDVQGILSLALDIAAITKSNDVDARESIYLSVRSLSMRNSGSKLRSATDFNFFFFFAGSKWILYYKHK